MNARPSVICRSPGCQSRPSVEGVCWTCPACVEQLRAERDRLAKVAQYARHALNCGTYHGRRCTCGFDDLDAAATGERRGG